MGLFKKKPIVFITIMERRRANMVLDYPKHLPLPRILDRVIFNELHGQVVEVSHVTTGNVTTISIILD